MNTGNTRLWGTVLLLVIAASFFHCYIDSDHLCLHHQPTGRSMTQNASADHDLCLCFTHGYFVPVFSAPQPRYQFLETPLVCLSENTLTSVARDIFHPPLS